MDERAFHHRGQCLVGGEHPRLREIEAVRVLPRPADEEIQHLHRDIGQHQAGQDLADLKPHAQQRRDRGPGHAAEHARQRLGDGPAFLTFDVDFVDPAFCPGTGTPEVGGPTSFEALKLLRACAGLPFVGFDIVEFFRSRTPEREP